MFPAHQFWQDARALIMKSIIDPFYSYVIILSATLTDKPLKSHFSCGDLNTIHSVFESLIFTLLVIIHFLISERQLFNIFLKFPLMVVYI